MKVLALFTALTITYGQEQVDDSRVVGGREADVGEYLWAANLRFSVEGPGYCGGSLIAPQYILTAAHCVANETKVPFVAVGSHFINGTSDGELIAVEWSKPHPKFNTEYMDYDVGLVKLSQPSTFEPIKLQRDHVEYGEVVRLLGWGRTSYPGSASEVLKQIDLVTFSNSECQKRLRENEFFANFTARDTHLCAGGEVDQAACHGDSGGPLVYLRDDNTFALVGDVSAGVPCGKGFPDLYGRISEFNDYIDEYVQGHEWV